MNKTTLFIDFETTYNPFAQPPHTLAKQATHEYIADTRTQLLGAAMAIDNAPAMWVQPGNLRKVLQAMLPRVSTIVAHNVGFDASIITSHRDLSFPLRFDPSTLRPSPSASRLRPSEPIQLHCTQALARYHVAQGTLPHDQLTSLASLAHLVGGRKGDTASAVAAGTRSPGSEALRAYALNDLDLCRKLYYHLLPTVPAFELALVSLHAHALADAPLVLDGGLLATLANTPVDPHAAMLRSPAVMKRALAALGVLLPVSSLAKTGELMQALAVHPDPRVRKLHALKVAGGSNIVRTRAARLLSATTTLGRFGCPITYYGAHTGRTTASENLNVGNLPRALPPPAPAGLRHALLAPPGRMLVGADSAQIEVRVLAWLASEHTLLAAFAAGRDVYREFASTLYSVPVDAVTPAMRQVAKSAVLGLGYCSGANGFHRYCQMRQVPITPDEAARTVAVYRESFPAIVQYWRVAEARALSGAVTLPSGRRMIYPRLETGFDGVTFERPAIFSANRKTPERSRFWRAVGVENACQSVARDVVMAQILAADTALRPFDARFVLSCYDEGVWTVPTQYADDAVAILTDAFCTAPAWAMGLPVSGTAHAAHTYGDLK